MTQLPRDPMLDMLKVLAVPDAGAPARKPKTSVRRAVAARPPAGPTSPAGKEKEKEKEKRIKRWNTEACQKVWGDLIKAYDPDEIPAGRRTEWSRDTLKVDRQFDTLYSEIYGLGVQLRWNIANSVLKKDAHVAERWDRFRATLHRDFFGLGYLPTGNQDTQQQAMADIATSRQNLEMLCTLIQDALAARAPSRWRNKPFTPDDFLCMAEGGEAVRNFEKYLTCGRRPPMGVAKLVRYAKFDSEAHATTFDGLFEKLDRPHDGRPIITVRVDGAPMEMCGLSHRIFQRFSAANDARPVLLIPCSRQLPGHGYRGLDFLVYNISNFLHQRPVVEHPPRMSADEVAERILGIRIALSRQAAVIVFAGYMATSDKYKHLKHAIKDKAITELLIQLAQPYIGEPGEATDAANFLSTRFVVLVDGEPDLPDAYCSDTYTLVAPPFEKSAFLEYARGAAPRYAEALEAGLKRANRVIPEADQRAFLQLRHLSAIETPLDERMAPGKVVAALGTRLAGMCSARELLMIRFIAASGAGLRPQTLWRCTLQFEQAIERIADLPDHLRPVRSATGGANQINGLLERFTYMLAEGADEPSTQLDAAHPFEYPDVPRPCNGAGAIREAGLPPQSIDFLYAGMRSAVLHALDAETTSWVRYLIHEILALESFRQQTVLSRHDGVAQPSLRRLQRALQGYYHGMLSLPAVAHLPAAETWPSVCDGVILPRAPAARFRFLYDVVLRRLVEGGEARRLSMSWATDELKKDMLRLAHGAFHHDIRTKVRSFAQVPVWAMPDAPLDALRPALEGHLESVAAVLGRTDDIEEWSHLQLLLEGEAVRFEGLCRPFSIAERARLDLAAVQYGPEAAESMQRCASSLAQLGCDPAQFEDGPWADGEDVNSVVDPARLDAFVESIWRKTASLPEPRAIAAGLARFADYRYQSIESLPRTLGWLASTEAYAILAVARRLAQSSGRCGPDWHFPGLSAQGMRVQVRAGLEMLRYLATEGSSGKRLHPERHVGPWLARLAREVREILDFYTLTSSNAPDRVSMLVLESRYARTVGATMGMSDAQRHASALQCLKEADRCMANFYPRPRLRIRFLAERVAALRGMGHAMVNAENRQLGEAARLLDLAQLDLRQLHQLVEQTYHSGARRIIGRTWRSMAGRQQRLTDTARQRLDELLQQEAPPLP